jgi:hypothetical protein
VDDSVSTSTNCHDDDDDDDDDDGYANNFVALHKPAERILILEKFPYLL